jgi:predicted RNA methylase
VTAVRWPLDLESPDAAWRWGAIEGTVVDLIAGGGRLLAVTERGRVYCFGPEEQATPAPAAGAAAQVAAGVTLPGIPATPDWLSELPEAGGGGYALAVGRGTEAMVRALVAHTGMHVVVVEADPAAAQDLRERFTREGLYGRRVSVVAADVEAARLPPYFATCAVATDPAPLAGHPGACGAIFRSLHPYRGVALLTTGDEAMSRAAHELADGDATPNAALTQAGDYL